MFKGSRTAFLRVTMPIYESEVLIKSGLKQRSPTCAAASDRKFGGSEFLLAYTTGFQ
jgi:hypothetical protein